MLIRCSIIIEIYIYNNLYTYIYINFPNLDKQEIIKMFSHLCNTIFIKLNLINL